MKYFKNLLFDFRLSSTNCDPIKIKNRTRGIVNNISRSINEYLPIKDAPKTAIKGITVKNPILFL